MIITLVFLLVLFFIIGPILKGNGDRASAQRDSEQLMQHYELLDAISRAKEPPPPLAPPPGGW
jgi:hypothetical protein